MQIGMLPDIPLCLVTPDWDQVAHRAAVFRPADRVMDRDPQLLLQNVDEPPAEVFRNRSGYPNPALTLEMAAVDRRVQ
jgi:hypothetical protein